MTLGPQGTPGHEICGRWCIYGNYIQLCQRRGKTRGFFSKPFPDESFRRPFLFRMEQPSLDSPRPPRGGVQSPPVGPSPGAKRQRRILSQSKQSFRYAPGTTPRASTASYQALRSPDSEFRPAEPEFRFSLAGVSPMPCSSATTAPAPRSRSLITSFFNKPDG